MNKKKRGSIDVDGFNTSSIQSFTKPYWTPTNIFQYTWSIQSIIIIIESNKLTEMTIVHHLMDKNNNERTPTHTHTHSTNRQKKTINTCTNLKNRHKTYLHATSFFFLICVYHHHQIERKKIRLFNRFMPNGC